MTGVVKSYHGAKGFGFIVADEMEGDIKFSRSSLPPDANRLHGEFLTGRPVNFTVEQTGDGRFQAVAIHIPFVEGKGVIGKITSYDGESCYGVIVSSSLSEEVHFGADDLPSCAPPRGKVQGMIITFKLETLPAGTLTAKNIMYQNDGHGMKGDGFKGGKGGGDGFTGGKGSGDGSAWKGGGDSFSWQSTQSQPMWPPTQASADGGFGVSSGGFRANQPSMQASPVRGARMMTGIIKSWSDRNGYGFLNVPGLPGDVKFSRDELLAGMVMPGESVTFIPAATSEGQIHATRVTPAHGTKRGYDQWCH